MAFLSGLHSILPIDTVNCVQTLKGEEEFGDGFEEGFEEEDEWVDGFGDAPEDGGSSKVATPAIGASGAVSSEPTEEAVYRPIYGEDPATPAGSSNSASTNASPPAAKVFASPIKGRSRGNSDANDANAAARNRSATIDAIYASTDATYGARFSTDIFTRRCQFSRLLA
jgi:hypothetical protein